MKVKVHGQLVSVEDTLLVANSEGIYECEFEFDEAWDGFARTACYKLNSGEAFNRPIINDRAVIPEAVLRYGKLRIGVFGSDEGRRMPTVMSGDITVHEGAELGTDTEDPGPTVYELIMDAVHELGTNVSELSDDVETMDIVIGRVTSRVNVLEGEVNTKASEADVYTLQWSVQSLANQVGTKASSESVTELSHKVGDLSELETTHKDNLVEAINEARQSGGGGGGGDIADGSVTMRKLASDVIAEFDGKASASDLSDLSDVVDGKADKTEFEPFIIHRSASGAVARFNDADGDYAEELIVSIEPRQEGRGVASPQNIRPIVGWDSIKVTKNRKNLFDPNTDGRWFITSQNVWQEADVNRSVIIPAENGKKYVFSVKRLGSGNYAIATLDKDKQIINRAGSSGGNVGARISQTVTANANTKYVIACIGAVASFEDLQLEIGSAMTDYEPYVGSEQTIDLGQTVYGGTLNVTTGELIVEWYKYTVDQTKSFATTGVGDDETRFYFAGHNHDIPTNIGGDTYICNQCLYVTSGSVGRTGMRCFRSGTDLFDFMVGNDLTGIVKGTDTSATAIEKFKTYITNNPLEVCYQLREPITAQLTPTQVQTLLGSNSFYDDCGNVKSLKYKANTNLAINEIVNAIIALGGNV